MIVPMNLIEVSNFKIGLKQPLLIIAGPCVIEDEEQTLEIARELKRRISKHRFSFIFKASYDKANRSSLNSFRGPGLVRGLKILERVQSECNVPILTDVHSPEEALTAANICDMIQIPAFLCRQTDLITAVGRTQVAVNIKKGQFLAPWDMQQVVNKLIEAGSQHILLTERGTTFGYNNLVTDFRSIPLMQKLGWPVCFDATHSAQLPGALGATTGGQREFIFALARGAVAVGCDALFMECHPNPNASKSDAPTVISFEAFSELLEGVERIFEAVNYKTMERGC